MKRYLIPLFLFLCLFVSRNIVFGQESSPAITAQSFFRHNHQHHIAVCPPVEYDKARCFSHVITEDDELTPFTPSLPSGYGPDQFLSAYTLGKGTTSQNTIIAIVDAYGDPAIFSDLTTYSSKFGLLQLNDCPVVQGTKTDPCFQKVDQTGGIKYPRTNSGWALETALDVEIAHAICQNCNILLVQAKSASLTNLFAAVDRARLMGATIISNSWGGSEFATETSYDTHFHHPGIAFTVSSGDDGYGVSYPASSRYVTAVGGTTLQINADNSYNSESAWSGAGSGCSRYESKPSFQHDTHCTHRTVADVSADADPQTGAAVYDSVSFNGKKGWMQIGGTSLSAPLIAGVYALANDLLPATMANTFPYAASASSFHDVIKGNNGACAGLYLCTAKVGYDGPTGFGTPNSTTGF